MYNSSFIKILHSLGLFCLLLGMGGLAQAQEASLETKSPMDLRSCINFAVQNNPNVLKAQLDEVATAYQIKEIKASGLPQLSGQAQALDNFSLPQQLLPGEVFGQPGTTIPVKFGVRYNFSGTAQLNQLLYNQSYFVGLKAAKASQSLMQLSTFKTIEDLVYNVAQVFLQIQQLEQQGTILDANLNRMNRLFEIAEIQYEEGLIKKIDVDQLRVNRTNLLTEQTNLELSMSQLNRLLKLYMNFPQEEELLLTGLEENEIKYELAPRLILSANTNLRLLEEQFKLNELERKNTLAGYAPGLAAFAQYGWQGQTDALFNKEVPLSDFTSGSWGLSLSIPIFDGGQKQAKTQQIKVKREQLLQDKMYLTQVTKMEFANANEGLIQNRRVLEAQNENMDLAEALYDVTQLSYKEGVAPLTELLNAETSLKQAQTQYLTALFQLKLSELDHLKTSGELANIIKQTQDN